MPDDLPTGTVAALTINGVVVALGQTFAILSDGTTVVITWK
jgi:hypothetical protein